MILPFAALAGSARMAARVRRRVAGPPHGAPRAVCLGPLTLACAQAHTHAPARTTAPPLEGRRCVGVARAHGPDAGTRECAMRPCGAVSTRMRYSAGSSGALGAFRLPRRLRQYSPCLFFKSVAADDLPRPDPARRFLLST